MRFLFCLDLSLHAGAGNFFGILNFATKQGPGRKARYAAPGEWSVYGATLYASNFLTSLLPPPSSAVVAAAAVDVGPARRRSSLSRGSEQGRSSSRGRRISRRGLEQGKRENGACSDGRRRCLPRRVERRSHRAPGRTRRAGESSSKPPRRHAQVAADMAGAAPVAPCEAALRRGQAAAARGPAAPTPGCRPRRSAGERAAGSGARGSIRRRRTACLPAREGERRKARRRGRAVPRSSGVAAKDGDRC
jgi:hypothetical protein